MKRLATCAIRVDSGCARRHFARRRQGDLLSYQAEPRKARAESGGDPRRGPDTMMANVWRWRQGSPVEPD